jgi:hypothetical protein
MKGRMGGAGRVEADNSAHFKLSVLGTWRISVQGMWAPLQDDMRTVNVTFNSAGVQLTGFLDLGFPGGGLPKVCVYVFEKELYSAVGCAKD